MKRYYVKDMSTGKIHKFGSAKAKALQYHQAYIKKHGYFTSDFGSSEDGFEQANAVNLRGE